MIGSESIHEEVARDAIEVLVAADLVEEALAEDVAAEVPSSGSNATMGVWVAI
jgi:hypothetical protein